MAIQTNQLKSSTRSLLATAVTDVIEGVVSATWLGFLFLWALLAARGSVAYAAKADLHDCPHANVSITDPDPVNLKALLLSVDKLRFVDGSRVLKEKGSWVKDVRETFDLARVKTKMEQFYRLLYVIAQHATKSGHSSHEAVNELNLKAEEVRLVLIQAGVFENPAIPNQISAVQLDLSRSDRPEYQIVFQENQVKVPINDGKGFYGYESGRCQHTQALIFQKTFSFTLLERNNGNLKVQDFEGVDLFGDFGSAGLFKVDIQYVGLKSVEFYKGKKLGKVKAFVSREEFRQNDHSPILKFITSLVGDTTVQPIDW